MLSSGAARMSATDPETRVRSCAPISDRLQAASESPPLPIATGKPALECERCAGTRRTCPSCVQRRRYAWSLVNERRETLESAAAIMELASERVRALVEEESQRRELGSLKCDSIPVELTRTAVEQALARDPDLRVADMARWLEMAQADFERTFIGKTKIGPPKRRVNVSSASRLMIALGRPPNELPGC